MKKVIKRTVSILTLALLLLSVCATALIQVSAETELKITKQPTALEPTVTPSVTDGAKYQWYKLGESEITPEDAHILEDNYSEEEGWSGLASGIAMIFFGIDLQSGDTIRITCSDSNVTAADFSLINIESFNEMEEATAKPDGSFIISAKSEGTYMLAANSALGSDITVKAYLKNIDSIVAVNGETKATLSTFELGEQYYCEISYPAGTTLTSEVVDFTPIITEQPTSEAPTVGVSPKGMTTFQWYSAKTEWVDITDRNAHGYYYIENRPLYDEDDGWIPGSDGDAYYYFVIEVKEGDAIQIKTSETLGANANALFINTKVIGQVEGNNGLFEFENSGTYALVIENGSEDINVTAKLTDYKPNLPIESQKGAKLTEPLLGAKYFCKVTWTQGEDKWELFSDMLTVKKAIIRHPDYNFTVETNAEDQVKSYKWYKRVLMGEYKLVYDGRDLMMEAKDGNFYPYVYDGVYKNGLWTPENGKIDIEIEYDDGYELKISGLGESFKGEVYDYEGNLEPEKDANGNYTFNMKTGGYLNFCVEGEGSFSAKVEMVLEDGSVYLLAEPEFFDDEDKIHYSPDVDDGYFEDGKWYPEKQDLEYDEYEIDVEVKLEVGSVIKVKLSEGFDGDVYMSADDDDIDFELVDGVYVHTVSKDTVGAEIIIEDGEEYTAEIYVRPVENKIVDGQTEARFIPTESGTYFAEVEYTDGTVQQSKNFDVNNIAVLYFNDGSAPFTMSEPTGSIKQAPLSAKEGYLLTGWYLDSELTQKATFPMEVDGVVSLYAAYERCDHSTSQNKISCTQATTCTACGDIVSASGHDFAAEMTVKDGKHYRQCKNCDAKLGEEEHSFTPWIALGEEGKEGRACQKCGHVETRDAQSGCGGSLGAASAVLAIVALLGCGICCHKKHSA